MAQINEMIISEINGLNNTSEKMRTFLKWLLEFERDNIDKERYDFRKEIHNKLNELLMKQKG